MSILFALTKKANKTANVTAPRNPIYLVNAECYDTSFTARDGREFEKICVRGTDAITGLGVAGIEFHGEAWSGVRDQVILSTYKKFTRDSEGHTTGEYTHSNGTVRVTPDEFEQLVADAEAQLMGTNEEDTDI